MAPNFHLPIALPSPPDPHSNSLAANSTPHYLSEQRFIYRNLI